MANVDDGFSDHNLADKVPGVQQRYRCLVCHAEFTIDLWNVRRHLRDWCRASTGPQSASRSGSRRAPMAPRRGNTNKMAAAIQELQALAVVVAGGGAPPEPVRRPSPSPQTDEQRNCEHEGQLSRHAYAAVTWYKVLLMILAALILWLGR